METAVTVLDNMMLRLKETIESRCYFQLGPNNEPHFEYCYMACGVKASASANSRIDARENVLRIILFKLAHRGYCVPPPFGLPPEYSSWSEAESKLPKELFIETIEDDFIPTQLNFECKHEEFDDLDETTRDAALGILLGKTTSEEDEDVLFRVASLIGATVQFNELRDSQGSLCMVELRCMSLLLEFEVLNDSRASVLQDALRKLYIALLTYDSPEV